MLIVKDDAADNQKAINQHNEFKRDGIEYVIGHLNSSMTEPVMKSQGPDLLFVSPSMSTDLLSGYDDFILRTSPINSAQAIELFEYCKTRAIDDMVIVYDKMNEEYTKTLYLQFKGLYEAQGYNIKGVVAYDSRHDDFGDVAEEIKTYEPEQLFTISQATDTAYIMQSVKQDYPEVIGFSVSWSMTKDLIQYGGAFVEGMVFIGIFLQRYRVIDL